MTLFNFFVGLKNQEFFILHLTCYIYRENIKIKKNKL
ncbi:hypothetical protein LCGC14_1359980 [marine sediment metagenome]|uniref:Uncharacterized protein n=1 Tax=marine sediment metagenome TaxID=412755 RepID=A0A0F9MNS1_9ZZZZ